MDAREEECNPRKKQEEEEEEAKLMKLCCNFAFLFSPRIQDIL
jgi:hypothetical protein